MPPEVSYAGGQLTIVARNSTMADVLNGVKQKTGAAVDMPVASSERVVGRFGPGAPRDVLAQLLNGSHYDYVLLGSPSDPGALKKIVLMARASGPEVAAQPAQNAAAQGAPGVSVPDGQANQGAMEDNSEEIQPDMQQQVPDEEPQAEQPEPGQNQPVIKTPEQLLRELQQQQQQQQQQQMQQQIQQQDQQNTNPPTMVPRRYPQQ